MTKRVKTYAPQRPFPVHALPEKIRNAVIATQQSTQSAMPMVATQAIAVAAEAVQGLATVMLPGGMLCLLTFWILVLASTGDGKTPSLNMLRKAFTEFETVLRKAYEEAMQQYRIDHDAWHLEHSALRSALRKAVRLREGVEEAKEALEEHAADEPPKPVEMRLTYNNVTVEALISALHKYWPNASLTSDEASHFLKGNVARNFAVLNQLWEPKPLSVDRRSDPEPIYVADPRVSLNWSTQPHKFDDFMATRGEDARDLGTLARFLLCRAESPQGERDFEHDCADMSMMEPFYQRIKECLQGSIGPDGRALSEKIVMTYSPEAARCHQQSRIKLEQGVKPGGWLYDVKDYAAKVPRHLARLAAVFEKFETGSDVISLDTLLRAKEVMDWYIDEYIRLMVPLPEIPQPVLDFNVLDETLYRLFQATQSRYVLKKELFKCLPAGFRNHLRFEQALQALCRVRGIVSSWYGRHQIIDLYPGMPIDSQALDWVISHRRT